LPSVFHIHSSASPSILSIHESALSHLGFDVLKLKTLGVHAPEPPIVRTSGYCDQTWRAVAYLCKMAPMAKFKCAPFSI